MQSQTHFCIILDIGGTLSKICFVSDEKETAIPHDPRLTSTYDDKQLICQTSPYSSIILS